MHLPWPFVCRSRETSSFGYGGHRDDLKTSLRDCTVSKFAWSEAAMRPGGWAPAGGWCGALNIDLASVLQTRRWKSTGVPMRYGEEGMARAAAAQAIASSTQKRKLAVNFDEISALR
jgi:hypothetical protein